MRAIIPVSLLLVSSAAAAANLATLENAQAKAVFDIANGGGLVSLTDKRTGQEFINAKAPVGLYEITLTDANRTASRFSEHSAAGVRHTIAGQRITITSATLGPHKIATRATCELAARTATLTCQFSVSNPTALAISVVRFPAFEFPVQLGASADDDRLLLPRCDGAVVLSPAVNMGDRQARVLQYPGVASAQLMAFYDKQGGVYAATYDAKCHRKDIGARRAGAGLQMVFNHYPALAAGKDFTVPYPVVVSLFHGDWQEAASIYKAWAVQQPWCRKTLAARGNDIPAWLKAAPFFYTMTARGKMPDGTDGMRYELIASQAEAYAKMFGSPVNAMVMSWEKNGAWRTPDYFPVYGGDEAFEKLNARLKANGNRSLIFLSGLKWTLQSTVDRPAQSNQFDDRNAFAREGEANAIVGEDGKTQISGTPGADTGSSAQLCPATQYAQNLIAQISAHCQRLGITTVQLDQVVGGGMPMCYSTRHGHPPGGGNWSAEALYKLFARLRDEGKKRDPEFAFMIEEPAEYFLPVLDAYHARDYSEGRWPRDGKGTRGVPLFTYIYHEYSLGYGGDSAGISQHESQQNIYSAAMNLVCGKIPAASLWTTYLDPAKAHPDQVKLLTESLKLMRTPLREFLLFGERLRELDLNVPDVPMSVFPGANQPPDKRLYKSVVHGGWRLPGKGEAWVFVNIANTAQEIEVPMQSGRLRLPPRVPVVVEVKPR